MKSVKYLNILSICFLAVLPVARADEPGIAVERPAAAARLSPSTPLERVEGEELSVAMGHFSRARSLLVKAVQEFDLGTRHANPDSLVDSGAWRNSLIDRAQELDKVLDPQPRDTKGGVKYGADSRLLDEANR